MESTADEDLIADALDKVDTQPPPGPQQQPEPEPPSLAPDIPSVISPTLESLPKQRRPPLATVCETCPNSVWFSSPKEVKCYCRVMYLVVWSTKEPNQITGCDGLFIGQEE